jgi:hypothetical protein
MNIIKNMETEHTMKTGSASSLSKEKIKSSLELLCPLFCSTAIETIRVLLGKECTVHLPWEVVDQLQGQFDRILSMGSSSNDFSAITCIGIQKDSIDSLLGSENTSIETSADILGEVANSYCGLLADKKEFAETFGPLTQAVPALYLDGNSFLPFIWGVQGYIYFKDHWIYFGYSIRNNASPLRPNN